MSDQIPRVIDVYVEFTYITMEWRSNGETRAGGSGFKRIWLSELPKWLSEHPGTMIVSIREV